MTADSIVVLLFARYAELFGATAVTVPVAGATDVASLVSYLRRLPGGGSLPERPLVAVNMRQVEYSEPVAAGDEVALLPPMAGG